MSDGNGGTATGTVAITVKSVNSLPAVSDIANQITDDEVAVGPLAFTVTDIETPAQDLAVSASSSNPELVPISSISLGGSGANRTLTVTPTQDMSGSSTVTVSVTDADGGRADTAFSVIVTTGPVPAAAMSVALQEDDDNNGELSPGDTLRYTVTIPNAGDRSAEGIVFTNPLPEAVTLTEEVYANSGTVTETDPITITGIDVPIAGKISIWFDVILNSGVQVGDIISSQGTVSYDKDDDGTNDAAWETDGDTAEPGIQPTIIAVGGIPHGIAVNSVSDLNGGNAEPGDELKYTVRMINQSGYDVYGIEYITDIPEHTAYVPDSANLPQGSAMKSEAPVLDITGIDVPAHTEILLSFRVRLNEPLPAGVSRISCQGVVHYDSDGDGANDRQQKTDGDTSPGSPGNQPAIIDVTAGPNFSGTTKTVTLVSDNDEDGDLSPGDTLEYTVIIPNTGDQDAAGVEFADYIPADTVYDEGSLSAETSEVSQTSEVFFNAELNRIGWKGDIPAGTQAEIIFRVTVRTESRVLVSNQGTVFYDSDDDGTNDASVETDSDTDEPGKQPAEISVSGGKSRLTASETARDINGGVSEPGDELAYTVSLNNTGKYYVGGAEFSVAVPAYTEYVPESAEIPPGAVLTVENGILRVTGIDIHAGDTAPIRFRIKADSIMPAGVAEITSQGMLTYDSDGDGANDNSTPTDGDMSRPGNQPTVIPVAASPDFTDTVMNVVLDDDADHNGGLTPYASG